MADIDRTRSQVADILLAAEKMAKPGGTAGQVLAKASSIDYDVKWITPSGGNGENGATFTPSVDDSGNLSWTNDKGLANPETVNIKGPKGDNGKTPVRGTDYWTDSDKAEIKAYVDEAILGGAW